MEISQNSEKNKKKRVFQVGNGLKCLKIVIFEWEIDLLPVITRKITRKITRNYA